MDTTVQTPRMDNKHEEPAAWAVRLVQRQHPEPTGAHSIGDAALARAIEALWALFDTSLAEANAAFEQMGEPGCMSRVEMTSPRARANRPVPRNGKYSENHLACLPERNVQVRFNWKLNRLATRNAIAM